MKDKTNETKNKRKKRNENKMYIIKIKQNQLKSMAPLWILNILQIVFIRCQTLYFDEISRLFTIFYFNSFFLLVFRAK